MSRGQLARIPTNFPRMKYRGSKRRERNRIRIAWKTIFIDIRGPKNRSTWRPGTPSEIAFPFAPAGFARAIEAATETIKSGDTKDHDQPATESELPTCPACVSNEVHWADRENPDPGCFEPFEPITHQSTEPEF